MQMIRGDSAVGMPADFDDNRVARCWLLTTERTEFTETTAVLKPYP